MSVTADMFSKLYSLAPTRNGLLSRFGLKFDIDDLDPVLAIVFVSLLTIGIIMVASSSISVADRNFSNPFYYLQRQLVFVVIGVLAALSVFKNSSGAVGKVWRVTADFCLVLTAAGVVAWCR